MRIEFKYKIKPSIIKNKGTMEHLIFSSISRYSVCLRIRRIARDWTDSSGGNDSDKLLLTTTKKTHT